MASEPNQSGDKTNGRADNFVREWREFLGLSQEELGELADVHYTTIGRIETGKRKLKTGFLRKLANIFGVDSSAILDVNPATKAGERTAHLLIAWKRMDDRQQE